MHEKLKELNALKNYALKFDMNDAQEIKCKMNDLKVLLNRITIKSFILLLIEILHEAGIRVKVLIKIHMKKNVAINLINLRI